MARDVFFVMITKHRCVVGNRRRFGRRITAFLSGTESRWMTTAPVPAHMKPSSHVASSGWFTPFLRHAETARTTPPPRSTAVPLPPQSGPVRRNPRTTARHRGGCCNNPRASGRVVDGDCSCRKPSMVTKVFESHAKVFFTKKVPFPVIPTMNCGDAFLCGVAK